MKNLEIKKELLFVEGTWQTIKNEILLNGQKVGIAYTVYDEENDDKTYLDNIDIDKEFQNQGIGTWAINTLAEEVGFLYFAPTDEDNKRLYERIAEEYDVNTPEVDQGFGVYYIEK